MSVLRNFAILAFVICASVFPAYGQNDRLPPPVEGLVAVVYPDLTGVEPKVANQIHSSREFLIKQSSVKETTNVILGNAYGSSGMVYHTYSMFEPAIQCYTNAAMLLPKDFRWRHLLGLLRLEQSNPAEAVKEFRKAALLNPSYLPTFVKGGNAALELDQADQARLAFQAALKIKPDEPAALYGMGQIEYQEKQFGKAAEHFEKVLKLVPAANRVHYSLALAYRGLNKTEKAKAEMLKQGPVGVTTADPLVEQIVELRQGNILKLQQAKLALEAGRPVEAIAAYKEIIAGEPENVTALVNIGAAYSMSKNYVEAAAAFEKAVAADPENVNAHYNLGTLYSLGGKPFEAIPHFKSVLKSRPEDSEARFRLAKELRKADLIDEALKEFRFVVEKNPENEAALTDLIEILNSRGLHKEVTERLAAAYLLFPTRAWTASAYAFALAKSPSSELRNGQLALEISKKVYAATGQTEHGFLVVLALAELGRCENAIELGKGFVEKAKQENRQDLVVKLTAELNGLSMPGGCIARK